MANWFENLTGTAGNVLDTVQDVLDVVNGQDIPAVSTPTTQPVAAAAAAASTPSSGNTDNLMIVAVVVVLAVVLLR